MGHKKQTKKCGIKRYKQSTNKLYCLFLCFKKHICNTYIKYYIYIKKKSVARFKIVQKKNINIYNNRNQLSANSCLWKCFVILIKKIYFFSISKINIFSFVCMKIVNCKTVMKQSLLYLLYT